MLIPIPNQTINITAYSSNIAWCMVQFKYRVQFLSSGDREACQDSLRVTPAGQIKKNSIMASNIG